jgi:uncharacterized protein (TIGR03382 family)
MKHTLIRVGWGIAARLAIVVAVAISGIPTARAGFVEYGIRNSTAGNVAPAVTGAGTDADPYMFYITEAGQKAALGSNDINGYRVGDIASVHIDRTDVFTSGGIGQSTAPYLNIWIKDALGNFGVLVVYQASLAGEYSGGYDLSSASMANLQAGVYEKSAAFSVPTPVGGTLTFGDFASYLIQAPNAAELSQPWVSINAPRDSGGTAYGVNWVFGDSQSNYVTDAENPYVVDDASVSATPEPATFSLMFLSVGALGLLARRRKA